jgi:ATP-binding cassette subfamily F protein uup
VIVAEGKGRWTEYAGGYTDMVAQRGFGVVAPKAIAKERVEKPRVAAAPVAAPSRQKLSFKQKHALETLPKEIARLEGEIGELNQTLADPGLYARDANAFAKASKALAAAQAALGKAEDEWLALEALREAIEG